jgi:betaine reductase
VRKDGGAVIRGNDILAGAVDVCVTDTLTGNVLMKMFSSFTSGGSYETIGWGYGPSCGEGWGHIVSIISRASGAPVIANALAYTAKVVSGKLCEKVAAEITAAKKAGLDEEIATLTPKAAATEEEVIKAPPAEPTDEEINGIDVLEIENAVKCLWKAGIYAESAMGCTGPVVKLPKKHEEKAHELLKQGGYL